MNNKILKILVTIILAILFIIGIYYTARLLFLSTIGFIFGFNVSRLLIYAIILFILSVLDSLFILYLHGIFEGDE